MQLHPRLVAAYRHRQSLDHDRSTIQHHATLLPARSPASVSLTTTVIFDALACVLRPVEPAFPTTVVLAHQNPRVLSSWIPRQRFLRVRDDESRCSPVRVNYKFVRVVEFVSWSRRSIARSPMRSRTPEKGRSPWGAADVEQSKAIRSRLRAGPRCSSAPPQGSTAVMLGTAPRELPPSGASPNFRVLRTASRNVVGSRCSSGQRSAPGSGARGKVPTGGVGRSRRSARRARP